MSFQNSMADQPFQGLRGFERSLVVDVEEKRLPGAVIAEWQGSTRMIRAVGFQDAEQGSSMREDSIFRIHSLTKPIVSLVVLMLIEERRLSLDDKLSRFLPVFSRLRVEGLPRERPEPTIRHLLTHTAGFTYEFMGTAPVHKQYMDAKLLFGRMTNAEFCEKIAEIPLLFEPGERWHYGHATDILGRLIEVIAEKPLGVFLSERIFSPLGMSDTGFVVAAEKVRRVANPFPASKKELADPLRPSIQEMGGHGLYSTASDYLTFLEVLAANGEFKNTRLVANSTLELMFSSQFPSVFPISTAVESQDHFGLGVALRGRNNYDVGYWFGWAGTCFAVDRRNKKASLLLVQQPATRDHYIARFLEAVSPSTQ